jgi:hypothetical protein
MIRVIHSGSGFFTIPDPRSRCQKGTGSRIRNTVSRYKANAIRRLEQEKRRLEEEKRRLLEDKRKREQEAREKGDGSEILPSLQSLILPPMQLKFSKRFCGFSRVKFPHEVNSVHRKMNV